MDGEKYVNDAVFRAEIRRIEQKVDSAVERMELKMDVYTSRMEGRMDKIESRIDGMTTFVGWVIALTGIAVAVGAIIIPMLK